MTENKKGRVFWIREPIEPRKGTITIATECKGQWKDYAPNSGAHWLRKPAFKVIEFSSYQKAVNALKEFALGESQWLDGVECMHKAREVLKELGEVPNE